jgi:hypothetical protein
VPARDTLIAMDLPISRFPDGAVRCAQGDLLVHTGDDGRFRVSRVDDLVALRRLVPLDADTVFEEGSVLDSRAPAYLDEIYLLLTEFGRDHGSADDAREAIAAGALGPGIDGRIRAVRAISAAVTEVVRPR